MLDIGLEGSEHQVVELFAGQRRICRLASAMGLRTVAHDILYDTEADSLDGSAFNLNSNAGFVPETQS